MKKILVFGMTGTIGGIETFFMTYYRKLNINEFNIDFATVYKPMAFENEIKNKKSKIFYLTDFKKNPFKYKKEIKKILNENNYDVVYINALSAANIIPLKISKKMKVPNIIVHSHNSNTPSSIIKKTLHMINKKKLVKYSTRLVACSNKAGNWMFGNKKFDVLNNAIDLEKFAYSNKYKEEFKKNNKYTIGHIGRYSEQKNHEFIIEIAEKLKNNDNIDFILIGEGENKETIQNLINEKNLNNITTINPREDVYKLYSSFDLFILPSRFEGLPIVGIEAQANGLPCLFSSAITRELKINENIEFLDINSSDLWVKEILKKPKRTNNIKLAEHGYDINSNCKKLEEIINEG